MTVLHVFARIGYECVWALMWAAFWLGCIAGCVLIAAVTYGTVWDWRQRRITRRRREAQARLARLQQVRRQPVRLPADLHNQLVDLAAHRMRRSGPDFAEWARELTETHGSDA